jgi:solute carrier family 50 protein (sugar transporter)
VIKKKSAESIHFPLSVTCIGATSMWVVYGLFIKDWFITAPYLLAMGFAIIQLILHFLYRKNKQNSEEEMESVV